MFAVPIPLNLRLHTTYNSLPLIDIFQDALLVFDENQEIFLHLYRSQSNYSSQNVHRNLLTKFPKITKKKKKLNINYLLFTTLPTYTL